MLTDVVSTLKDVTPNLVNKQHYGYDPQFFNQILVEEYDFGNNAPGLKLRSIETQYVSGGNYTNPSTDPTKNANLRSLASSVTIKDGNGSRRRPRLNTITTRRILSTLLLRADQESAA